METYKLNNGTEEFKELVLITFQALKRLFTEQPIYFYELMQLAKNKDHKIFGNISQDLLDCSLLNGNKDEYYLHDSIKNIVLSSIKGEGFNIQLINPIITE